MQVKQGMLPRRHVRAERHFDTAGLVPGFVPGVWMDGVWGRVMSGDWLAAVHICTNVHHRISMDQTAWIAPHGWVGTRL